MRIHGAWIETQHHQRCSGYTELTTKRRWLARVERLGASFLKKACDDQTSPRSSDLCQSIESKRQTRGNISRSSSSARNQHRITKPLTGLLLYAFHNTSVRNPGTAPAAWLLRQLLVRFQQHLLQPWPKVRLALGHYHCWRWRCNRTRHR